MTLTQDLAIFLATNPDSSPTVHSIIRQLTDIVRVQHEALEKCRRFQVGDELDRIIDPVQALSAPIVNVV